MTNNNPRLSAEMLAAADALRNIRLQVHQLANADHPASFLTTESTEDTERKRKEK